MENGERRDRTSPLRGSCAAAGMSDNHDGVTLEVEAMRELVDVTETLRRVREAEQKFILRFELGELLMAPNVLDRVAADMALVDEGPSGSVPPFRHWCGPMDEPPPKAD